MNCEEMNAALLKLIEVNLAYADKHRVCRLTGLSISTINNYARGAVKYPRLVTIVALLEAFGYTLTYDKPEAAVRRITKEHRDAIALQ